MDEERDSYSLMTMLIIAGIMAAVGGKLLNTNKPYGILLLALAGIVVAAIMLIAWIKNQKGKTSWKKKREEDC